MAKAWCKHYRGMHGKDECDAGVRFDSLTNYGVRGFYDSCPCFGPAATGQCGKAEYPTAAELAAIDRWREERFAAIGTARQAIVAALGGPWKRGTPGSSGAIDCPVCSGHETLRFSRSGYNGHIHAACSTEKCVRWME